MSLILYGEDLQAEYQRINSAISADIEYLRNLYPCGNNSRQEKIIYQFIRERLISLSISYIEQPLDTVPGVHSFSSNIVVDFVGTTSNKVIFAFPVNNLKDNSFNIATALKLCEIFSKNTPEKNVKILFLGSEFLPSLLDTNYLLYDQNLVEKITIEAMGEQLGARTFLQYYFPDQNASLIYINIENYENIVEISNASQAGQAPLWFIRRSAEEMEKNNINFFIDLRKNNFYKLGYNLRSHIDIFMQNNTPSLYVTTTAAYNRTLFSNRRTSLKQEELATKFISFLVSMSNDYPKLDWEVNYLIIPFRNKYFFLKEKYNILIYLAFIAAIILFIMKYSNNFFRYTSKLLKNFGALIWLFLLCFLSLFLATLVTEFILSLKGSPSIWIETPAAVFFIKIISATLFLFFSLFLLQKIRLPYSSNFYSAGAIFLMVINLFIFQFFSITLSFIAMWGLIWTILFSFAKNRWIKTGCLIISYYFIFDTVRYIFMVPAIDLCDILISSKFAGNILIAATLLPCILMILRILHIQTRTELKKYKFIRKIIYAITLLAAITSTTYYYWFDIYRDKKMPVLLVHKIDTNKDTSIITMSSPVRTEDIEISIDNNNYIIKADNLQKIEIMSNNGEDVLEIQKTLSWFLNRKNIVLDIIPKGEPEKIEILFRMAENQLILDSNFQFTLDPDLMGGIFHIGYNPDFPLKLDILTDMDTDIRFDIRLIYRTSPLNMEIRGNNMTFYTYTVVFATILL